MTHMRSCFVNRVRVCALITFVLALAAASFAFAENFPSHNRVEIVSDQKAGTVKIVIDGKAIMNVDERGVHVTGNVDYSGFITDTNGAPVKEKQP